MTAIKGADILALGYPQSAVIGLALRVASHLASEGQDKGAILATLGSVLQNPENAWDGVLKEVADALQKQPSCSLRVLPARRTREKIRYSFSEMGALLPPPGANCASACYLSPRSIFTLMVIGTSICFPHRTISYSSTTGEIKHLQPTWIGGNGLPFMPVHPTPIIAIVLCNGAHTGHTRASRAVWKRMRFIPDFS